MSATKTIFTEKQIQNLLGFGLNRTQSILYLTSLKYGILSVLELSKLTKINRQQIYTEAEKLVDLGIYDITRKQGRKYIAAEPSRLIRLGKKKLEEQEAALLRFETTLPLLESLSPSKKNKVTVRYYEGQARIKEAYEQELAAAKNTEVLSLAGSIEHAFEFFPESYWDKWNKKFVKQGSSSRMLVHDSAAARSTAKHDTSYKRDTRYLSKLPLKVNIDVFNNTVLIVSYEDELGLWIESPTLAESYKILFNTLWPLSRQFE